MAVRFFSILFIVAMADALPAKSIYDNASANDVDINSVHLDNADATTIKIVEPHAEVTASVPISTVKVDVKLNGTPTQHQAGSGFSRLIDDIFNIPITVLQSVARLLRNPFKQEAKSPESSPTY